MTHRKYIQEVHFFFCRPRNKQQSTFVYFRIQELTSLMHVSNQIISYKTIFLPAVSELFPENHVPLVFPPLSPDVCCACCLMLNTRQFKEKSYFWRGQQRLPHSFLKYPHSSGRLYCSMCILEVQGMFVGCFTCLVVMGGSGIDSSTLGLIGERKGLENSLLCSHFLLVFHSFMFALTVQSWLASRDYCIHPGT